MTSFSAYIDVAIALPVPTTYTYGIPRERAGRVSVGCRVLVPFGPRRVTGYILAVVDYSGDDEIKPVLEILDDVPLFPETLIPVFRWMADYYIYPLGEVIKTALPGGLNLYEQTRVMLTASGKAALERPDTPAPMRSILERLKAGPCHRRHLEQPHGQKRVSPALFKKMQAAGWISFQQEIVSGGTRSKTERVARLLTSDVTPMTAARKKIIAALADQGDLALADLKKIIPTAAAVVRGLARAGALEIYERTVYRDPFGEPVRPDHPPALTGDQQVVLKEVGGALGKGFKTFLLAGVTGSGKTEIYLSLARRVLEKGGQVLVLVPEIALISQVERRFRARFGEQVAVLHSSLSAGERFDQWRRIVAGQAPVVIGARSAIFAPLTRPGLIVVDEEHDTAFKQETGLRYNARDLAVVRAKISGAVALLGSATPAVQTFYNTENGKFRRVALPRRVENRPLPVVSIFDLRQTKGMRGSVRIISEPLHRAMRETLDQGNQVLLFLNRRGFAGHSVCLACGEPVRCRYCDITLTLHQSQHAYRCHYCGFSRPETMTCAVCGSASVRALGIGTEKVEALARKLFPDASVARMDRDTTARKGSIQRMLKQVKDGKIDILVGTQMVAKGHDFPNITLVGIICADLSLDFPDFRSGERTFQLLAQVAGRTGRGNTPGRVILQTYNPGHFTIQAARDQDYPRFYQREIHFRQSLRYPPFAFLVQLKISGRDRMKTRDKARAIGTAGQALKAGASRFASITLLGPIEAPLAKISGRYRWQIFIKGLRSADLHDFVRQLAAVPSLRFNDRSVRVVIDVDPYLMM